MPACTAPFPRPPHLCVPLSAQRQTVAHLDAFLEARLTRRCRWLADHGTAAPAARTPSQCCTACGHPWSWPWQPSSLPATGQPVRKGSRSAMRSPCAPVLPACPQSRLPAHAQYKADVQMYPVNALPQLQNDTWGRKTLRHALAQTDQDAVQPATSRQLLAAADTSDAAAAEYRCREPIAPANAKYCAALFRTLDRCRRLFGRFTLRCNDSGATACSTRLALIRSGRCSAPSNLCWSSRMGRLSCV